jgi:uncharacterized phage-associated protein
MADSVYDARAIANLMLDEAHRHGRSLTNLALQKLLYFAHALYLVERKRPLLSGYFEAWEYGPVHPAVYQSFKSARDRPINFRAQRHDLVSGGVTDISQPSDPAVRAHVARIVSQYGGLTPGRLVQISHAKGAPWHFVVDSASTFGVRITDDVILACFKHHKISVGPSAATGDDPGEDTPPA